MTIAQKGTKDIKLGWLAFLANAAFSLSRLRKECPTICTSITASRLKYDTDLMFTAEKDLGVLGSRLMATWAINPKELWKMIGLGPEDYVKHMNWKKSTDLHSRSLRSGQTKKSRRK